MKNLSIAIILSFLLAIPTEATQADSTRRIGFTIEANPSSLIVMDGYQKKYQKKKNSFSIVAEMNIATLPKDSSMAAVEYGFPVFSVGARYGFNDVTMHRSPDSEWPYIEEQDYDSELGDIASVYGSFYRTFLRTSRWHFDYSLTLGMSYAANRYNTVSCIDNELVGSHFMIYFGSGLHATYWATSDIGIRLGLDFFHHSNGAIYRPNKGANFIGPSVGVTYQPSHFSTDKYLQERRHMKQRMKRGETLSDEVLDEYLLRDDFKPYLFARIAAGVGLKSLNEDWQVTQFSTPQGAPDYRTSHFNVWCTQSMSAELLYRYRRRWASGIGLDLFHVTYANHIRRLEENAGNTDCRLSNWSAGVAAKHQAFFGRLSMNASLGFYLYRKLGTNAAELERPCYETIGLRYAFPSLGGLEAGFNVKAHKAKADYTEIVLSLPIKL